MIQPGSGSGMQPRRTGGLRPVHGLMVVAAAIVAAVVAFAALSFLAGVLAAVVKIVVIVAIVGLFLRFLAGRSKGSGI